VSDAIAAASEAGVLITAIIALVVIVWLLSRDTTQPPH
jgi:hypothetical protein